MTHVFYTPFWTGLYPRFLDVKRGLEAFLTHVLRTRTLVTLSTVREKELYFEWRVYKGESMPQETNQNETGQVTQPLIYVGDPIGLTQRQKDDSIRLIDALSRTEEGKGWVWGGTDALVLTVAHEFVPPVPVLTLELEATVYLIRSGASTELMERVRSLAHQGWTFMSDPPSVEMLSQGDAVASGPYWRVKTTEGTWSILPVPHTLDALQVVRRLAGLRGEGKLFFVDVAGNVHAHRALGNEEKEAIWARLV